MLILCRKYFRLMLPKVFLESDIHTHPLCNVTNATYVAINTHVKHHKSPAMEVSQAEDLERFRYGLNAYNFPVH